MEISVRSTGVDVSALTADVSKAFQRVQKTLGKDIATAARKAVLDDVRTRRRGGLRFGTNRKTGGRYKLGARPTIELDGSVVTVTVRAAPAGFWSIVEYGSAAHEIKPRPGRSGLNGRAAALEFDELYSTSAWHPGTSGAPFWAGAESALDKAVTPIIEDAFDDAIEEAA